MMIDASALVAIVLNEPEAERFLWAIAAAPVRLLSVVNWLETTMVIEARMGEAGGQDLAATIANLKIAPFAFDLDQLSEARRAWQRYGKGRHRAKLNLGDCCAYAASVTSGEPLLFKGEDFTLTDVEAAPW